MKKSIAETIIFKCLGLKRDESLLIVTDESRHDLAYGFYRTAGEMDVLADFLQTRRASTHGGEPDAIVAGALKESDAALLMTSMSLSHTRARKEASGKYGVRIASMPGITEDILERSIVIDYDRLSREAKRAARLLTKAKRIEIRTKRGTSLTMSAEGRTGFSDDGLYLKRGAFGNLPAGEACMGPLEGTANGRLIVDASSPFIGRCKEPMEIKVEDGFAGKIPLKQVEKLREEIGRDVYNVAELGIGLNPAARITGNILEDEKVMGTAHIAFGNNISFGGKVGCPSHLDFVFYEPEIILDGKRLSLKK